jgi:hypothetical protein
MHDTESDTFVYKTWPEKFVDSLAEIGVESEAKEIASLDLERGDYYSRYFSQTPRMVTNKECLEIKNTNIDVVQIIQKG